MYRCPSLDVLLSIKKKEEKFSAVSEKKIVTSLIFTERPLAKNECCEQQTT